MNQSGEIDVKDFELAIEVSVGVRAMGKGNRKGRDWRKQLPK